MKNAKYNKVQPAQKLATVNSRLRHGDLSKISKKTNLITTFSF